MAASYDGVVVLGTPRSGTTLLRRLLNAHPAIACPPETNLLNSAARFLEEERFANNVSVGSLPGLGFSGYAEDEVIARLRTFVFGFLDEIRDKTGKPVWAEKTAFDSFYIDTIERLCGDRCRYICITRHALDQICSVDDLCRKMQMYMRELHRYIQRYSDYYEAFAHAWVDVTRRIVQFESDHPDWCVRVKYEDLASQPAVELTRILEHLGLPTDVDAMIAQAMGGSDTPGLGDWKTYESNKISTQNVGRRSQLPRDTVSRLAGIVNPTLLEAGYEPVETEGSGASAEQARRAYQMGLMIARMKASKSPTGSESDD